MLLSLFLACGSAPEAEPPPEPVAEPAPAPKAVVATVAVSGSVGVASTKNKNEEDPGAPVAGGFGQVSGELKVSDFAQLSGIDGAVVVPVSSWDSGNEVRDERLLRTFFEAEGNPQATFEFAAVRGLPEGGLVVGQPADATVDGRITLHGQTVDVSVPMSVTTYAAGHTKLLTETPIDLSIASFGLGDQLAALIVECGHASVEDAVQVTIDVTLTPAGG
ncbi:MAG: YceI family protein [Proteobacteria bacterium]|nr:YceI family protein [Pseudomonadota bacterium]